MTVIAQDDHLTAGAWAACVLTSLDSLDLLRLVVFVVVVPVKKRGEV